MGNIFFVTIVLIFCFLMITEGFLWHKSLRKKNVVKREKEWKKSSDSEIHMPEDLYWCKQWEHKWHGRFETCVSDLIEDGGLLQIHCIAIEHMRADSWLVRGCATGDFQKKIREAIHAFQVEMGFPRDWYDMDDSEFYAHIWYYNPDGSHWSGADDIPMRIAITFHRPIKVEEKAFQFLQQQIYEILWETLDNRR
jgi:hypothetical protein